ncbi:hypothetical protein HY792_07580, partial [Candidatus Desantisbacteria bacterium]|nr:hypothetical protein [Candidatus Desantisbacteria bacterium]
MGIAFAGVASDRGTKEMPERMLPVTTLRVDGLRAVLCDTEIKTTFVVPDINNPETLLQIETSRLDASILKYLTNIDRLRGYFSKLKLKTSLKFNGRVIPCPFTVSGKIKADNLLGKEKFLVDAGFIYKDDVFDSIDIDIDKKTSIKGKVFLSSFSSSNPSDLVIECHQTRVLPLLGLSGIKGMPELEKGNISGRLHIRPDNYEGKLTLDTSGAFQSAVLTLKGQEVETAIAQAQGGSVVASCQWSPGSKPARSLKINASARDFIWNHSRYSFYAIWDAVGRGTKEGTGARRGEPMCSPAWEQDEKGEGRISSYE